MKLIATCFDVVVFFFFSTPHFYLLLRLYECTFVVQLMDGVPSRPADRQLETSEDSATNRPHAHKYILYIYMCTSYPSSRLFWRAMHTGGNNWLANSCVQWLVRRTALTLRAMLVELAATNQPTNQVNVQLTNQLTS